jgi:hypothetical protein
MTIKNKQDFMAGMMFVILGIGFAVVATDYSMGTAARMGPGYFPFWLGVCMAVLGAFISLGATSVRAEKIELERFDWSITVILLGSVALSGLLLDYLGVYISVFLLVVLSSFASHEFSWKVSVANAFFLVAFVWLAFIKGLGLIFPLWPTFLHM